jgi:kynureninase
LGKRWSVEALKHSSVGAIVKTVQLRERFNADRVSVCELTLSHTASKSGYVYDMAALTAAAQAQGTLVLWDPSHSVGAVPLDLRAANVDLAIGCTYKYLNGGSGAPAFLYVRRDLQARLFSPIAGWMGQERLFDFDLQYQPAPGMRRFLSGTPTEHLRECKHELP